MFHSWDIVFSWSFFNKFFEIYDFLFIASSLKAKFLRSTLFLYGTLKLSTSQILLNVYYIVVLEYLVQKQTKKFQSL